jgi:hypothetical protein
MGAFLALIRCHRFLLLLNQPKDWMCASKERRHWLCSVANVGDIPLASSLRFASSSGSMRDKGGECICRFRYIRNLGIHTRLPSGGLITERA